MTAYTLPTSTAPSSLSCRGLGAGIAIALLALAAGCGGRSTTLSRAPSAAGDPTRVEVWEKQEPAHAFVPAGDLWARTLSKPATLEKLREEAARFYMDGIYAIDCQGPLYGECTAVGFVYEDTHAAGNAEPSRDRTIASR